MIEFTRAPVVAPGDRLTSSLFAQLAAAPNDRLRSGLGDPTKRIQFLVASMFRQMRNPDSSGFRWPAQHEFFTAYQGVPPDAGTWPLTAPGLPEGANVTNPIAAAIWGNEAMGLPSEDARLAAMPWDIGGRQPTSHEDWWRLAQAQRGGFDPTTGAVGSPALDAARSWSLLRYSRYSPHANAYGGFQPGPELSATPCDDPDPSDLVPAPPNYQIFFTALRQDVDTSGLHGAITADPYGYPVVTYAGTCQAYDSDGDGTADTYLDHIAGMATTPWVVYVGLWSGVVDVLPVADWLWGPYVGNPRLQKTDAGNLPRIMHSFAREFRGTAQQQTATDTIDGRPSQPSQWNQNAFDVQRFMTHQYLLAPARGRAVGNAIIVDYPTFSIAAPSVSPYRIQSGSNLTLSVGDQSGTEYAPASGCVVAGVFARATRLADPVTLAIMVNGAKIASLQLNPLNDGAAQALHYLSTPVAFGLACSVSLTNGARSSRSGGSIEVELAELLDYKPDISDMFLALRVSGALLGGDG